MPCVDTNSTTMTENVFEHSSLRFPFRAIRFGSQDQWTEKLERGIFLIT